MKQVAKHYITIKEVQVSYSEDFALNTLERRVEVDGELIYAEKYPIRCIDKFAQPELQAFIQMVHSSMSRGKKTVHLSKSFYKTLCIILACIWLITVILFINRDNLSV